MPGIDLAVVRQRVPMAAVLARLDFRPSCVRGHQLRGPCPVHRSPRPGSRSFAAHLERGCYRCFGCGSQGNVLDLWAAVHGLSLHAAAENLCATMGIEIPWMTRW
jgi:DNA primase